MRLQPMRGVLATVLAALVVTLSAPRLPAQEPEAYLQGPEGPYRGRVLELLTEKPLEGASVLAGLRPDERFMRTDEAGVIASLVRDATGSTIALTGEDGGLGSRYTYDPFGRTALAGPASDNPFRFQGREADATGLLLDPARIHEPTLQRYIQETGGDVNPYVLQANSSPNRNDPAWWRDIAGRLQPRPAIDLVGDFGGRKTPGGAPPILQNSIAYPLGRLILWGLMTLAAGMGMQMSQPGQVESPDMSKSEGQEPTSEPEKSPPPKAERNPNQDRKLTDREIKKLEDKYGVDVHDVKEGMPNSDLYKDRQGNVHLKPKGQSGVLGEPTGLDINDD